jgi:hypothetical protein
MPLELGIFLGIKQVTPRRSRRKTCLIFVKPNEPQYGDVLKIIRDWLKEVRFLVSAKSGASASVKVRLMDPGKST